MIRTNLNSSKVIIFATITFFGSSLSAVATFLQMGREFKAVFWIAVALSCKTLSSFLLSKPLSKLVARKGTYPSLLISQLLGLPVLVALFFAFQQHSPILVVLAIIFSSLPSIIVNLLFGPLLRDHSKNQDDFKKNQGIFQICNGLGMLLAGILSPFLLDSIDISGLYVIDAISFLVAATFLFTYKSHFAFANSVSTDNVNTITSSESPNQFFNMLLICVSALFLVGLIPTLASSSGKSFGLQYSRQTIELLWLLESLSGIAVGYTYSRYGWIRHSVFMHYLPLCSCLPLLLLTRLQSTTALYSSLFIFAFLFTYGINRYRDDYIELATDFNSRLKNNATYQTILNMIRTFSPLIIWLGIEVAEEVGLSTFDLFAAIQILLSIWILVQMKLAYAFLKIVRNFFSKSIQVFSLISTLLISGIILYRLDLHRNNQVNIWLESIPRSILPQLIESDYIPLQHKIELLEKTNLFKSIKILNTKETIIAGFGESNCERTISIKDEAQNDWGSLCFSHEQYTYTKILLLPLILLSILLMALSHWLSTTLRVITKNEEETLLKECEKTKAIQKITSQVAHDIRSPLAVLDLLINSSKTVYTKEEQSLIRSAVSRIKDIANQLLTNHVKSLHQNTDAGTEQCYPELLFPLLEEIISESRARHHKSSHLFTFQQDNKTFFTFANIDASILRRVFANLINNAVESYPAEHAGPVEIALTEDGQDIVITIKDYGKGIPENVRKNLGKEGITYGKEALKDAGTGLGIPFAIKTITSWGGLLEFIDNIESGTTVQIKLKKSPTPIWFMESLTLPKSSQVIICDDDSTYHQLWIDKFRISSVQIHPVHSSSELKRLFAKFFISEEYSYTTYLIDYDLNEGQYTGLELIQDLGLHQPSPNYQVALVTSRYEDINIRQRCEHLKIKLIPKIVCVKIPILFV